MEGTIYRYYVPKEHYAKPRRPSAAAAAAVARRRSAETAHHSNKDSKDSKDSAVSVASPPSLTKTDSNASAGMDGPRTASASISGSSVSTQSTSRDEAASLLADPFELRHGRRYLRDTVYPLPCDLAESHRQSLRTLMGATVFGQASCAPSVAKNIPKKVLEIGCGSGYWSATCHEWFASLGSPDVSFTGFDLAPVAPDFAKQGMNWRFVQHDLRRMPWPFDDGEFDYIMVKDLSLALQIGPADQRFVDEFLRVLAEDGTLEIWESDHLMRSLLPHPPAPRGMTRAEEETATATRTFLISTSTPFAPAQNKYIRDSNSWITEALDKLKLSTTPCARVAELLCQEPDTLCNFGSRRVAIPLGELRWERDAALEDKRSGRSRSDGSNRKPKAGESLLTPDQAALRHTALLTVLQKIESLEPLLKSVSSKNSEEWSRWWGSMTSSLLEQDSGGNTEVLELGSWWATKRTRRG